MADSAKLGMRVGDFAGFVDAPASPSVIVAIPRARIHENSSAILAKIERTSLIYHINQQN